MPGAASVGPVDGARAQRERTADETYITYMGRSAAESSAGACARRQGVAQGILDHPEEENEVSHSFPTPLFAYPL